MGRAAFRCPGKTHEAEPLASSVPLTPFKIQLYSSNRGTVHLIMLRTTKNDSIVVSALHVRSNLGRLLRRVEDERRSLVIEKRGTPRAVLLSIRDYVRLAAPEPEVLKLIGQESQGRGTDRVSSRQIDQVISAARAQMSKRRSKQISQERSKRR